MSGPPLEGRVSATILTLIADVKSSAKDDVTPFPLGKLEGEARRRRLRGVEAADGVEEAGAEERAWPAETTLCFIPRAASLDIVEGGGGGRGRGERVV